VAGRKRVPSPATGKTALRMMRFINELLTYKTTDGATLTAVAKNLHSLPQLIPS
jgi:hypothetical protein